MSHCVSVTVEINGKDREICTVVPGNERIHKAAEQGKIVKPTREELDRAVDYHLKNHKHETSESPDEEMQDLFDSQQR